jgi:hypothetical protein
MIIHITPRITGKIKLQIEVRAAQLYFVRVYHNKVLTAAEVMDELIKLSKEIISMDDEASELSLTEFEYAFYTAVLPQCTLNDHFQFGSYTLFNCPVD